MGNQGNRIEQMIQQALDKIAATTYSRSDATWTRAIKNATAEIGIREGYDVCAAGASRKLAGNPEWLFDLCWLRRGEQGQLVDVVLALECEWTPGQATQDDFRKLLASRSRHRVFITWAANPKAAQDVIDHLAHQVKEFAQTRSGDRYAISCYVGSDDRFLHHVYAV